jgi:hypothetical protein
VEQASMVGMVGVGGTGSVVMQQLAGEPELRADTIAGWLAARTGDDPLIGAEVAAHLGCGDRRCSHPRGVVRSSTFVRGFAWGARELAPAHGQMLENVVLYASDVERSRQFYEELGLSLSEEQHGNGPRHYSCRLGSTVFELYPASSERRAGSARIELSSSKTMSPFIRAHPGTDITCIKSCPGRVRTDPDGNRVATMER